MIQETEHLVKLEERLPRVLNGDIKPLSADESIEFAKMCDSTKRYGAAARLYAEAFVADPKLIEQVPHRYYAACAAALAGCGQGQDEPPLSESQRARWRMRALEWLRAQLEMWTQRSESNRLRARARQQLGYWRYDPKLAGVRDPALLSRLPEEEHTLWQGFWKDVDALLNKLAGDTK
jgi:hypothetical protein